LTHFSCKLFDPSDGLYEASFVERLNRFVVRGDLGATIVDAHCPNPGRLLEILIPGTTLLLKKRLEYPDRAGTTKRRLDYSLVAARHRGILIPLASARANDLAERIVLPLLFPEVKTTRREITLGKSRLDFLLQFGKRRGRRPSALPGCEELFLEVKACTLIEEGTAMFPDAPTLRGLKHLEELETLAAQGRQAGLLFVLMNPQVQRFVPNLHTDPAFTRKLLSLRGKIWMRAVSIQTAEDGSATVANPDVPIDLAAAAAVQKDSGVYLLIITLRQECRLTVGSLGEIRLASGWYVYAGSGRKNLSARIARHHRRRKKLHWHIDFLLDCAEPGDVASLPIRSRDDLECSLAQEIATLAADSTPGFGCSDCGCLSHLFRFANNPLLDRRFLDLLLHYRHTVALACSSWEAMSSASQG
jgi:sugar fermentation stimulation protein A